MYTKSIWAFLATVFLVATLTATPAEAAPAPIRVDHCGQTIDRDAYLAHDLTCNTEFGVRLLQSDFDLPYPIATLDLRGHTLTGSGSGIGVMASAYPSPLSLSVHNGYVDNWGSALAGDSNLNLSYVVASNSGVGISCNCSGTVDHSTLRNNKVGLTSLEGGMSITNSVITGSDVGSAVWHLGSGSYVGNTFSNNKVAVQLQAFSSSVSLERNVFTNNGMGVNSATTDSPETGTAIIKNNVFRNNRDGIYLPHPDAPEGGSPPHQIGKNMTIGNSRYGIYAPASTDLGGNMSLRNRRPCVGVVCYPR